VDLADFDSVPVPIIDEPRLARVITSEHARAVTGEIEKT
jgi:hypothetical protein